MAPIRRDFERWVQLRLSMSRDSVDIAYVDETGRTVSPADGPSLVKNLFRPGRYWDDPAPDPRFLWPFERVTRIPDGLPELLETAFQEFQRLRHHLRPDGTSQEVPWLLPVFVVPPVGLEALPWERWMQAELLDAIVPQDRCVAVRHQKSRNSAFRFALPLWIHDSRPVSSSIRALKERRWYAAEEAVRNHGVTLTDANSASQRLGRRTRPHVLVRDGQAGNAAAPRALGLTVEVSNRVVDIEAFPSSGPVMRISGVATDAKDSHDPIVELVYGLIHDYALHELVWILRRTHPRYTFDLCCDPCTNQALRLSTAMSDMRTDYLSQLAVGGRFHQLGLEEEVFGSVRNLVADFTQERRGLTSMARAIAGLELLRTNADPTSRRLLGPREDLRRVEMLLDRYDEFGVIEPLRRRQLYEPFRAGWRYRLGVQIGLPNLEYSVFEEPPPDIDSRIPWDSATDRLIELEVCVYAKSFKLLSAATQKLVLSRSGPTRLIHFDFKAPVIAGVHDLRIALYAGNNLVQSFLLSALVAGLADVDVHRNFVEQRDLLEAPSVTVRLTSSAVSHLSAAEDLPARALSVALNDDADPAGHTLMVKGASGGVSARTDESKIAWFNARYRDVLQAVHNQDKDWAATVRDLAKIGQGLWNLLAKATRSEATLNALRGEGETLQFVRHSSILGMPWQLLYDFHLPSGEHFAKPTVCRADSAVVGAWPRVGHMGCRHHPGKPVICVEGFWAFRHRLELLSEEAHDGQTRTRVRTVHAPAPHPLLTLGASLGGILEQQAEAAWRHAYPQRFHRITQADAPVHTGLWSHALLPAVLLLLSHLYDEQEQLNLERRVYACEPTGLDEHEISATRLMTAKVHNLPWEATRPIVMLMACESARQDTHELVSLTDAFLQAGAAAVIGTEWNVKAWEALDFGKTATAALLSGKSTLGQVMQAYYRQGLTSGQGVPMLFTAYGNADLSVMQ